MSMTYEQIKNHPTIRTYIAKADESLIALGFTEHSFAHVTQVAERAGYILETLGYDARTVELAKIAVDAAGKSMKRVWTVLYVPCPYSFYERVKLEVAAFDGIIRQTDFGSEVELEILLPEAQTQPFLDRLTDMSAATIEGMETGQEYRAFPVT